jgi:hypothetical protein
MQSRCTVASTGAHSMPFANVNSDRSGHEMQMRSMLSSSTLARTNARPDTLAKTLRERSLAR